MKSFILLEEIQIFAHHGVLPQETIVGNSFVLDVKITTDLSKAIASDELNDTINYARVYELVEREMTVSSKLLEHVAGRIIKALRSEFNEIDQIEVKISKINPPIQGQVHKASIVVFG